MKPVNICYTCEIFPDCEFVNVSFNMSVSNIDRIDDMGLSNQIRSWLLWIDLHPAPDIVCHCEGHLLKKNGDIPRRRIGCWSPGINWLLVTWYKLAVGHVV